MIMLTTGTYVAFIRFIFYLLSTKQEIKLTVVYLVEVILILASFPGRGGGGGGGGELE